jgi:hypothetical protein
MRESAALLSACMDNRQLKPTEILSRLAFAAFPGGGHYRLNQWCNWSASDIAKLRVLAEAGSPPEASGDALGRMERSIAYKARDLGIKIPASWAAYFPKPKYIAKSPRRQPLEEQKPTLEELKAVAKSFDNLAEDSREFMAAMVVMYPIVVGGMDVDEIALFTSIGRSQVQKYVSNLRESGIWTADDKISLEADPNGKEVLVELILQTMCALGMVKRTILHD